MPVTCRPRSYLSLAARSVPRIYIGIMPDAPVTRSCESRYRSQLRSASAIAATSSLNTGESNNTMSVATDSVGVTCVSLTSEGLSILDEGQESPTDIVVRSCGDLDVRSRALDSVHRISEPIHQCASVDRIMLTLCDCAIVASEDILEWERLGSLSRPQRVTRNDLFDAFALFDDHGFGHLGAGDCGAVFTGAVDIARDEVGVDEWAHTIVDEHDAVRVVVFGHDLESIVS